MRNKFTTVIRIYLYKIILFLLFVTTGVMLYLFLYTSDDKYAALFGGTATGLIVAIIQYLLDLNEHNDIENIKRLGIREILPYREGKEYYNALISRSRKRIDVLGNTANRFLEDFASLERDDSRSLLEALNRGVIVRILLPKADYLSENDKLLWNISHQRMQEIARENEGFQYRYFDHPPSHSIVLIDDEILVGPIFPHISSKNSPAIHTTAGSAFVKEYIVHFDEEWKNAKVL